MQQAAMCNLKGRILSLLDVINWQGFKLIVPGDILADTQTSLAKTAMLSRVKLEPDTVYKIYGFYLQNKDDLLPTDLSLPTEPLSIRSTDEACCYYLGNHLYVILIKNEKIQALTKTFIAKQQLRGSLAWHQLQLKHKQLTIYPETRGLFLPHRIDLHLSGYLSFDKGCYKGQEIVARTHYRAKLKHGLQIATIETDEPLHAGKKLFNATRGTEIGELIDYSPIGQDNYLIAASMLFEHPSTLLLENQQKTVTFKELGD